MRRILVGLGVALCGVSLAAAQSTTTTVAPPSSTTIASSTSTSLTTSTSATTVTIPTCGAVDASAPPQACARACKSEEGSSKEECRTGCCSSYFDALVEPCNAFGDCDDGAWDDFVTQWNKANSFYNRCLRSDNTEDPTIAVAFERYNLPNSCREYVGGCRVTALRHANQCADAERCVTCCRTTLRRWRQAIAADLRRVSKTRRCQKAIRCLRRGSRKAEACRDACRRTPTCGQDAMRECLASKPAGREVLTCYGKCADKCSNRDAYPWCIQACNGLKQCVAFDACVDSGSTTVTSTSDGTAFAAHANGGACLIREDRTCEVTLTTTSTSTTSSTAPTTTSTSSSTTTSIIASERRIARSAA